MAEEVTMPAIFTFEHSIRPDETEQDGLVKCQSYLLWTRAAALAHSIAQGWPTERYEEIGAAWVARSDWIEYRQPAIGGETVIVETWVSNFRKTKSLRKYRILRPDEDVVLVTAETNWALIDLETRMPRRIPAELSGAFPVVSESDEP